MASDLTPEAIRAALSTTYVGRHLVVAEQATSTMDLAAAEAANGAAEGTVVVAEEQTGGRGRFGRPWISPKGAAVYLSILLRPAPELLPGVNIAAPLAVAQAAHDVAGVEADIKWPNDVQACGRKFAGVLVDAATGVSRVDAPGHAIVGIGLNVSLDAMSYPEIAAIATSLKQESGRDVSRLAVLASLLRHFEMLYDRLKAGESLLDEWRTRLNVIQKRVTVTFPGFPDAKPIEGVVTGIDDDAALVLQGDDGTIERLIAGEVSLR